MKYTVENLFSKYDIANRITELGESISEYYENSRNETIFIGLLRGSFIFIADLCRAVSISHSVDFMTTSSYQEAIVSTRDVKILKDLNEDIQGKNVLIVEDIIDSGNTLRVIHQLLRSRKPKSIATCALLDKPSRRETNIKAEWVGFTVPDEFIVGYGIDHAQNYRHLPYVGKLVPIENF